MWTNIGTRVLDSVIAAVILGGGTWFVSFAVNGDLIRWLGGATAADLREIESTLFDLSDLEFAVETRTLTQEAEQAEGGPETVAGSLKCGEGWYTGPVFSETYLYQGARRKYIRMCFRERPERSVVAADHQ